MNEITFKNRTLNRAKLAAFGFAASGSDSVYCTDLVDGQIRLTVTVDAAGRLFAEATDTADGEEYILHRVPGAVGAFVGRVRSEYEAALNEIADKCFDPEVFKEEQTKAILAYLRETYGDEPEYLWQKFPDNAILRRKDNRKWYAAILTVSRRKLGLDSDEIAEILDLRIDPEELEQTVDHIRYFPGYHMNKKHWITLCLDGTLPLHEICDRIDNSYRLAVG